MRGVVRSLLGCTSSAALSPAKWGAGVLRCKDKPRSVAWQTCMPATALPASKKVSR